MAAPVGLRGREATRLRLRRAAWDVFRRDGLEATTVRAIAAQAGTALGSLYTYYPDKQALLEDLALSALGEVAREVAARRQQEPVPAVSQALLAVFGHERAAAPLLAVLLQPQSDDFARKVVGRLLTALAPLTAMHADLPAPQRAAHALAAACFVFGLALFDAGGLMRRLGGDAAAAVEAYRAR